MSFYNQIISHTSYFAVCGARGCIRGCMDVLEKGRRIEQRDFATPVSPRPAWQLGPPAEDPTGGIAEGRFPDDYNRPDPSPGAW